MNAPDRLPTGQQPDLTMRRTVSVPGPGEAIPQIDQNPGLRKPQGTAAKLRAAAALAPQEEAAADEQADDGPALEREDVASIDVCLPGGLQIEFGPPPDVSVTLRVAQLAGHTLTPTLEAIIRVCLCVRLINGRQPPPITNMVDVTKMAGRLGDRAIDALWVLHAQTWPAIQTGDLTVLKKNLR